MKKIPTPVLILALAGCIFAWFKLSEHRGRELERLEHATDSLTATVDSFRAREQVRDEYVRLLQDSTAHAERRAAEAAARARTLRAGRDSVLLVVAQFDSFVPRPLVDSLIAVDSAVMHDQQIQIEQLGLANAALHSAFHVADSSRMEAIALLDGMMAQRDDWRKEARRANRIGLVVGGGYTLPSGDWQLFAGVAKRIRLPFGL